MRAPTLAPTGREVFFDDGEIIVSKTDLQGRITYANEVFVRVSGYSERELLGKPHNLIRHPHMPRAVFGLLWQTIAAGREIFAYVVNMARNGDHYWVLAHITPTFDAAGQVRNFHSNRRTPDRRAVDNIQDIYARLLAEEARHANPRQAIEASTALLSKLLSDAGKPYDEFVFSL